MLRNALLVAVAAMSICFAAASNAGIITGTSITLTFSPTGGTFVRTVVAGEDLGIGTFGFDFDHGIDDDIFDFQSEKAGSLGGSTSFTLSGLLFDDGATLSGFNLFSTSLPDLVISTTATSVTFAYVAIDTIPGTVLRGQYITTAVPEPSPLGLLAAGLLGLFMQRKRVA